jgi:hypothetical protein
MQFPRIDWSAALTMAGLSILLGAPLHAAEQSGLRTVAEELGNRTKAEAAPEGGQKGMSDSRVRVMSTYALSILPDEVQDKSGNKIKLDKSDPGIYLIPLDDARGIIRVATRSAYAEACGLYDLEKANFQAMYLTEQARRVWSKEQMMFIQALHTFATSYFTGNVKITEQPADAPAAATPEAADAAEAATTTLTPKKLECRPGQKEKVTAAINNYVKSTGVTLPEDKAPPAAEAPAPKAENQPQSSENPPALAPVPLAPVAGSAN